MGKKTRSKTLPSSPTHSFSSSSSSDFEFTISLSPRKSSNNLCPADELFYKGQLLPLHLSPRISMVRTLLLASSSTSSSSTDTTTTASRDSTGSSASTDSTSSSSFAADLALLSAGDPCCDSSRPSSVTEEDEFIRKKKPPKYFSKLSRFSNVFKKDPNKTRDPDSIPASGSGPSSSSSSMKRMISSSAKEMIRKYLKKVKPLYERLSQRQQNQQVRGNGRSTIGKTASSTASLCMKPEGSAKDEEMPINRSVKNRNHEVGIFPHSFSGNLRHPLRSRKSHVASCPSSMRSSPSHSGILSRPGMTARGGGGGGGGGGNGSMHYADTSTMEELQSAIQGAIAHCKNSMLQSSRKEGNMVSQEH